MCISRSGALHSIKKLAGELANIRIDRPFYRFKVNLYVNFKDLLNCSSKPKIKKKYVEKGNHSYLCYAAGKNDVKITLAFNIVQAIRKMHTQG